MAVVRMLNSLLIAGESGWDESSIAVDPAGLGAFSFLRPEYVKSVPLPKSRLANDPLPRQSGNEGRGRRI